MVIYSDIVENTLFFNEWFGRKPHIFGKTPIWYVLFSSRTLGFHDPIWLYPGIPTTIKTMGVKITTHIRPTVPGLNSGLNPPEMRFLPSFQVTVRCPSTAWVASMGLYLTHRARNGGGIPLGTMIGGTIKNPKHGKSEKNVWVVLSHVYRYNIY